MPSDFGRDIATNTADIKNISGTLIRLEDWMRQTSNDRRNNHEDVIQRLSKIEEKQTGFNNYQEDCDDDRGKLTARITLIENRQSWRAGRSSLISAAFGAVAGAIVTVGAAVFGGK